MTVRPSISYAHALQFGPKWLSTAMKHMDAAEAACVRRASCVCTLLTSRCKPQIFSSVIERVTIDVIDLLMRRRIENKAMHPNGFAIARRIGVAGADSGCRRHEVPPCAGKNPDVGFINEHRQAIGENDLSHFQAALSGSGAEGTSKNHRSSHEPDCMARSRMRDISSLPGSSSPVSHLETVA